MDERISQPRSHHGLESRIDRFGALASMLCAVHCALLPLLFGILPALGLAFLADHAYEQIFVSFAIVLASISLLHGLRKHGSYRALLILVPGILLLVVGMLIGADHSNPWHATVVSIGGTLVALSHVINMRLTHVHGPSCRH
ncbi:MAG TPA: MerC domain-containing protein [Dokdonella sp.]|uniref:MerC domain-containing protein n=1 Tax=Dokdonella sp. TaxID=2291710 RepID=UPI002D805A63|nr:MerC domain-containing protein [Dokdonella sp.]HET9033801.1 MerC domain-containing protein [Dokdonella sp.]